MLNPIIWRKVQGQKHPGTWGIVDDQIPRIKVLFKTNAKSHKHPGFKLSSSESKTQLETKNFTKDRCSIPMDMTAWLGPLKFSLRATIDHHGPSIHSGHYTASINCCKNILLQRLHNHGVWHYWQQKLLYCIYYTIWIDWHMLFGLEQEDGSLIAPMALAHPLHPIDNRSRNKRRKLWVGWCVSSWWPLFPSRSSVLIYICIF